MFVMRRRPTVLYVATTDNTGQIVARRRFAEEPLHFSQFASFFAQDTDEYRGHSYLGRPPAPPVNLQAPSVNYQPRVPHVCGRACAHHGWRPTSLNYSVRAHPTLNNKGFGFAGSVRVRVTVLDLYWF